jgi:hypothetical protein
MAWYCRERRTLRSITFQSLILADLARLRDRNDSLYRVFHRSAELFHARLSDLAERSGSKLWIAFARLGRILKASHRETALKRWRGHHFADVSDFSQENRKSKRRDG